MVLFLFVNSIVGEKKTTPDRIKKMKTKLNDLISTSKSASNSHGLSVAQDARLEFGLQWLPELRMRVSPLVLDMSASWNE